MRKFFAVNRHDPCPDDRLPLEGVRAVETDMPWSDFIGLGLLVLLLLSPLVFKCRIVEGLIIHPFMPLLLAAWGWVAWVSRSTFSSITSGWYIAEWQAWNVPVVLLGTSVTGLALSLAVNSLWLGSLQKTGWLLLAKWVLYLAPLPLTALLTLRRHVHVIKVVSYVVPVVALGTLLYSSFRLWQAMGGRYSNAYIDAASTFLAMGTFAEVWSVEGLSVRSDTMSHTAYGMYLAFMLIFSLCLALFAGWNGIVHRRYADAQAFILGPLAIAGILLSGSRASLVLMVFAVVVLQVLLLLNPGNVLTMGRRVRCAVLLMIAPIAVILLQWVFSAALPTIDRLKETLVSPLEIERTVIGEVSPVLPDDGQTKQSIKNLQTRVWIWGRTVRFLLHHPGAMVLGIGYDRRRFVEAVIGLPYVGPNINYQTAHNVYLDILVKGGIVPLIPLVAACGWLFWTAVKSVLIPAREHESVVRIGIGWVLLSFWPALLVGSLAGEELLTDNLMLHWAMLFGLLLGLVGLALSAWLPKRILHMTAAASIGGGPTYITAVVRHQQEAGKEVRIFCSDEKPFVEIWKKMGIDVSILPMRRPSFPSVWQLLKELLRAPAPIHAHGRGAAFFALWVKILVRIPVIYTPHGPHYAHKQGWRFLPAWCFEYVFRVLFDAVLYVSPGEQEVARIHHLPVQRSRVVLSGLIREGSSEAGCQPTRDALLHELNIPTDRFVIGWIGRFDYAKGLDLLLNSISQVSARLPHVLWVVIGDGDGEDVRVWRDRIAGLGLAEKVVFLGARHDACRLIAAFDLYVSTSRWEGLPLVLLEVMEQGVPIAASEVVGNRDVVNGWGYLFPAYDVAEVARAQIQLVTDGPLRMKLAAAGRDMRQRCFTLTRMLNELDDAYREILGPRLSG